MGLFRRHARAAHLKAIIDLTAFEKSESRWGLPSPCPECGKPGYLDHIDPYREVMFQHCPSCWNKWQLSRAEIESTISA
jgi:hypothetical protein